MPVVGRGLASLGWQPTAAIIERSIGYIVVRHFAPGTKANYYSNADVPADGAKNPAASWRPLRSLP
jgi:hypothetical protein